MGHDGRKLPEHLRLSPLGLPSFYQVMAALGVLDKGGRDLPAPGLQLLPYLLLLHQLRGEQLGDGVLHGPGVHGNTHVGQGGRWQYKAAVVCGLAAQAQGVGRLLLPLPARIGLSQVGQALLQEIVIGVEEVVAGPHVELPQPRVLKLLGNVVVTPVQHLVSGGLLGIGGQAVILQGIAGQA